VEHENKREEKIGLLQKLQKTEHFIKKVTL
jgi:hypothetical protein